MKEKYTQKVAFLNGLQPWARKQILQRLEVLKTCQKLLKVVECMEDDSAYPKSNLTLATNSKEGVCKARGDFIGKRKKKWEKNPYATTKEKRFLMRKN
jgi:hypothetical protein